MSKYKDAINLANLYHSSNFFGHYSQIINNINLIELDQSEKEKVLKLNSEMLNAGKRNISAEAIPIAIFQNKILTNLHLRETEDSELQKIAFKNGVNYIDIEASSQCNRVCNYCTNSINDRKSNNYFMDWRIYERLINQLSLIQYSDKINFVGYNEPLMHKEILKYLDYARVKLPNAILTVFTNGDYLDFDYLKEIEETKINNINISIHQAPGKLYNEGEVLERVMQLSQKLKLSPVLKYVNKRISVGFDLIGSPLSITMSQRNYNTVGHNRGGLLDTVERQTQSRKSACSLPFNQFIIGHTGEVMPCCVLVHDDINHKESVVGDLNKNTIFEIYTNEKYVNFRKSLLNLKEKKGPCKTCTGAIDDEIHNNASIYDNIAKYM